MTGAVPIQLRVADNAQGPDAQPDESVEEKASVDNEGRGAVCAVAAAGSPNTRTRGSR
jgi:hypothetical protein